MVDFNPAIGYYCNDGGLTFLMPGASKYKSDALKNSHKIIKKTINSIRSQTKATNVHDSFYDLLKPLSLCLNILFRILFIFFQLGDFLDLLNLGEF